MTDQVLRALADKVLRADHRLLFSGVLRVNESRALAEGVIRLLDQQKKLQRENETLNFTLNAGGWSEAVSQACDKAEADLAALRTQLRQLPRVPISLHVDMPQLYVKASDLDQLLGPEVAHD